MVQGSGPRPPSTAECSVAAIVVEAMGTSCHSQAPDSASPVDLANVPDPRPVAVVQPQDAPA